MAFPATYNINYYQGDTYDFIIRPKTSLGEVFPVSAAIYDGYLRIDDQRGGADGTAISQIEVTISDNALLCTIPPTEGNKLSAGNVYYYDVSIENKTDPNIVYTLLTGTITVTDDIATGA